MLRPVLVGAAELVGALAIMDRPDSCDVGTSACVHGQEDDDLAMPYYAEILADVYQWIKSKTRANDTLADNGLDFARWWRQKPGTSEEPGAMSDAEVVGRLTRFTEAMRDGHGEVRNPKTEKARQSAASRMAG